MAVPLTGIEPLREILSRRPLGLCSDIDGTLSPIVPRPEDARLFRGCRRLLEGLSAAGMLVVLTTGRSLADARRLVGLEGVAYAANHGLTIWLDGREESSPEVAPYTKLARLALAELAGLSAAGVRLEDKGPVLALHYRQAPDETAAHDAILSALGASPAAGAFRVQEGRKVIELRPPLEIDKGMALAEMVKRLGLRGVLCLGDDVTDADMFRSLSRLRGEGLSGAAVAVRSEETTPHLLEAGDYVVEGVAGVKWLLSEVLKALG